MTTATVIRHAIQDDGFTLVITKSDHHGITAVFQYYTIPKDVNEHFTVLVTEEGYPHEVDAILAFDQFNAATKALKEAT